MKTTGRDVAISLGLIIAAMVITNLATLQITAAKQRSSVKASHSYRLLHQPKAAFNRERVLANEENFKEQTNRDTNQVPTDCETAASILDNAVIDTKKLPGAYLIIIARLGTGETSNRLNQNRLAVVEEYVLRRGSDLKYVLAQATRIKGFGRLELYVGGQLKEVLAFKRNAGPCSWEGTD